MTAQVAHISQTVCSMRSRVVNYAGRVISTDDSLDREIADQMEVDVEAGLLAVVQIVGFVENQ